MPRKINRKLTNAAGDFDKRYFFGRKKKRKKRKLKILALGSYSAYRYSKLPSLIFCRPSSVSFAKAIFGSCAISLDIYLVDSCQEAYERRKGREFAMQIYSRIVLRNHIKISISDLVTYETLPGAREDC